MEDKRWFCIKMRDGRVQQAAPIMAGLWDTDDRLVRIFILQYCTALRTPATSEIAWRAYTSLPEKHELQVHAASISAAHVQKLDALARRAIPVILKHYDQDGFDARSQFEGALSRAAGRTAQAKPTDEPTDIANRLKQWQAWWKEIAR
jgi:hypothetical protein